jgi:hypothetical protein
MFALFHPGERKKKITRADERSDIYNQLDERSKPVR